MKSRGWDEVIAGEVIEHLLRECAECGGGVDGAMIGAGDDLDVAVLTFGEDEEVEFVDLWFEEGDGLVEPEVILIPHCEADALLKDGAVSGGVFAQSIGDVVGAILGGDAWMNLAGLGIDE